MNAAFLVPPKAIRECAGDRLDLAFSRMPNTPANRRLFRLLERNVEEARKEGGNCKSAVLCGIAKTEEQVVRGRFRGLKAVAGAGAAIVVSTIAGALVFGPLNHLFPPIEAFVNANLDFSWARPITKAMSDFLNWFTMNVFRENADLGNAEGVASLSALLVGVLSLQVGMKRWIRKTAASTLEKMGTLDLVKKELLQEVKTG